METEMGAGMGVGAETETEIEMEAQAEMEPCTQAELETAVQAELQHVDSSVQHFKALTTFMMQDLCMLGMMLITQ